MSLSLRPLALLAVLTGTALIAVGLAMPTPAILTEEAPADDSRSGAVVLEPRSDYAGIADGELVVELEDVNERAVSTFDRVFTITTQEERMVRLETDVEGVEFYRGDNTDALSGDDRLDLEADETVPVGMVVDTADAAPDAGSVTVYVESDPTEPTYAVRSYVFTGRLFALFAVQTAIGLLLVAGFVRRRRDIWPVLP
jgi:hypothetical protein